MRLWLQVVRYLTYPLGWLYAVGTALRNYLYDIELLKSTSYRTALISVGNITVGGTGKTPMVEYLLQLISPHWQAAMLSRGYRRKSRGFQLATPAQASSACLGDEPYQIYRKFPQVRVVVDANRREALSKLEQLYSDTDVVVLDDAFQHRQVEVGLSILLIDYHRMITRDWQVPYGCLRESARQRKRADVLLITKCPEQLSPLEARQLRKELNPKPYQELYFTRMVYGEAYPIFPSAANAHAPTLPTGKLLLVTAIATPEYLQEHLQHLGREVIPLFFPDHHTLTPSNWKIVAKTLKTQSCRSILLTEKDAAKLYDSQVVPSELKPLLYTLPVQVEFLQKRAEEFNQKVLTYIQKNKQNSVLFN